MLIFTSPICVLFFIKQKRFTHSVKWDWTVFVICVGNCFQNTRMQLNTSKSTWTMHRLFIWPRQSYYSIKSISAHNCMNASSTTDSKCINHTIAGHLRKHYSIYMYLPCTSGGRCGTCVWVRSYCAAGRRSGRQAPPPGTCSTTAHCWVWLPLMSRGRCHEAGHSWPL